MASRSESSNAGCAYALVGVVCLAFGTVAVLVVYQQVRNTYLQWRSESYEAVQGTISQSELKTRKRTSELKVRYDYQVAGEAYHGTVIRHGSLGSASNALHRRWAKEFPVGAAVTVHHDARHPEEAVLVPGFLPVDAAFPLLLMFFVELGFGCLILIGAFLFAAMRRESIKEWLRGSKFIRRGTDRIVRLNFFPPLLHRLHEGFAVTAVTGLVIGLVGLFALGEIEPTGQMVSIAWAVALGLGFIALLRSRPRSVRFRPDWSRIEISGDERRTIDFEQYAGLDIQTRHTGTHKGVPNHVHDICLMWNDESGTAQRLKLRTFGNADDARFAVNLIDGAWREANQPD